MWSLRNWRRQRTLAKSPVAAQLWHSVCQRLPILDGLSDAQLEQLRDASVLFLHDKHLTALPGVELDDDAVGLVGDARDQVNRAVDGLEERKRERDEEDEDDTDWTHIVTQKKEEPSPSEPPATKRSVFDDVDK